MAEIPRGNHQRREYGALSIGEGLVHVTWHRWEERNGPVIEQTPTSDGSGRMLVRRSIVGQLGDKLDYTWKLEGFSAFISIPMERLSS
jgi:two-component sensor histidine kinase